MSPWAGVRAQGVLRKVPLLPPGTAGQSRMMLASAALSSPGFLADSVEDEFELSTVCHRPEGLEQLQEQTKFTRKELQVLYRGFKNVSTP